MELMIKPSKQAFSKANDVIKLIDKTNVFGSSSSKVLSKVAKDIKTIKPPITRYFESTAQLTYMYAESEYDLVAMFKLLKHEAYFMKATQKKHGLLTKSGVSISADDDDRTKYISDRFRLMQLETGTSYETIVKQLAFYLIVCSNAFLIKTRDDDPKYGQSYKRGGKEMKPISGLFLVHPTQLKPKFKYQVDKSQRTGMRLVLDKWVHTNRRGVQKEFNPEDVAHFHLYKEDGMLFGMPEVIPVIDDIRTLRKIEEDIQLLIYRDLFPIIHYRVEQPGILDHRSGLTELEQAQRDMNRMMQDGGIATDKRHEIEFVGNKNGGIDARPFLDYFKTRVFSGLGVSSLDMGEADTGNSATANSMSSQIIDAVKFIQQELAQQFKEKILDEMMLQSGFDDIWDQEMSVNLKFQEIDLEWKIKSENHEADLYQKGVKHIHETRNKIGMQTMSDEDLDNYTAPAIASRFQQREDQVKLAAKSAAERDGVKAAKSNSNITKSKDSIQLADSIEAISIHDEFKNILDGIYAKKDINTKMELIVATKVTYDRIKSNMIESIKDGMAAAAKDLGLESYSTAISHNVFESLDKLRDNVVSMVYKDKNTLGKASMRVATANKTEQLRGYNYGYALVAAVNNNKNKLTIYSDVDDISEDSLAYLGKEIEVDHYNILNVIPPFRPNSRLKVKYNGI